MAVCGACFFFRCSTFGAYGFAVPQLHITSLDLTRATPELNLACDEALLDWAEAHDSPGLLRFWESDRHFVVLGYANRVADEVNVEACRAQSVPILRRCSGGGTVLQGPGCVNYAIILPMSSVSHPSHSSPAPGPEQKHSEGGITAANQFIMGVHRAALTKLLGKEVTIEGHTDLAIAGRKFSGNAQRRKRTHLLFHGSFLLGFDLELISQFLRFPSRQPAYREGREHLDFLTTLDVRRDNLQLALQEAWGAREAASELNGLEAATEQLCSEKYAREAWNMKW